MQVIGYNLMNIFWENFEFVDFGSENEPFTPFRTWSEFHLKPQNRHFYPLLLTLVIKCNFKKNFTQKYVYWTPNSCKKSEKSNEPTLRKLCYRRTDVMMTHNIKLLALPVILSSKRRNLCVFWNPKSKFI